MLICTINDDRSRGFLEVPAWMFDAAVCCRFLRGASARVDVGALRALRALFQTRASRGTDVIEAQHHSTVPGGCDAQNEKVDAGPVLSFSSSRGKNRQVPLEVSPKLFLSLSVSCASTQNTARPRPALRR
jgi:hypothetical protein